MRATVTTVVLPLRRSFRNSRGVITKVEQPIVMLAEDGHTGFGTVRGAEASLVQAAAEFLTGRTSSEIEAVRREMEAHSVPPAVRACFDVALHDLIAQRLGIGVRAFLGIEGLPVEPSAVTLPVGSVAAVQDEARRLSHLPVLKLKVTPGSAAETVCAVREIYSGRLRVDGNGAFDSLAALRLAEILAEHKVELFEQPTEPSDRKSLVAVHRDSPIPVAADEAVESIDDIVRLAGQVSCVNIKLMRLGGIRSAIEAIAVARAHGIAVMLGSKVESALGVTAAGHLAGLADYVDLDGATFLQADVCTGLELQDGSVRLPSGPGLGCDMRVKRTSDGTVVPVVGPTI